MAKKPPSLSNKTLQEVLVGLRSTGWSGFEGLVVTLLREVTGLRLVLASAGLQGGLDAATTIRNAVQVAVECKRYADSTPLSERGLRSEIEVACERNPELDCWILVTSREITTQEDRTLSQACSERGIAYLSLATAPSPNVGCLDALCAACEDLAVDQLTASGATALVADFRQAVASIRARAQYGHALTALRDELQSADIGFPNFIEGLNARLVEDAQDRVACKRRFRCALTVEALQSPTVSVSRTANLQRLQALWQASQADGAVRAALVLGDEGTGKSWVVSEWIRSLVNGDDAPAVFFVPAQEPESGDALRLLTKHARQYALPRTTDLSVERKLQRWLQLGKPAAHKRAVVVLDGINERPEADLWADLIEELSSSRFASVFLVVTCRLRTWRDRYSKTISFKFKTVEVGDFTQTEFEQAIRDFPKDHQKAIRSAGAFVRRPRYFHLASQRVANLPLGEELTAEALYYFDWEHRESLKRGMAIDGTEFADAIRDLAREQRAGRRIGRSDLEAVLGAQRFAERQEELASTLVIERVADGWRLKTHYFALGLGMYLADRVEQCGGPVEARCVEADEILGDTSSLDLTTSVLRNALLHALLADPAYSTEAQVALLSVWANALNSASELNISLPRLQIPPELLLTFADYHWRQDDTAHVMEQAVLAALVRVMRTASHLPVCLEHLVRWVGLVHENGESDFRSDERPRPVHADVNRLCHQSLWQFPASKVTLRREQSQLALRLGRLAIAAASACGDREYWPVISTAFVADQAMGGPRTELLAWLVRWFPAPIDDLVDETTSALVADADPVCWRAGQRMLSILGSQALLTKLDSIGREHFPADRWAGVEEGIDPCMAFFRAPTIEELPRCLERDDVPLHIKIDRARSFAADLLFPYPESFVAQVAAVLDGMPAARLWRHMGHGDADHTLAQVLPLGFRLAPEAIVRLVQRIARDCISRSGVALRQASVGIEEFSPLLDADGLESIWATWFRIALDRTIDVPDRDFVESEFAQALLECFQAPEQLEFLRLRGAAGDQPRVMARQLKQLAVAEQRALQSWSGETGTQRLALWFLTSQRTLDFGISSHLARAAMTSSESANRGLALAVALRLEPSERQRLVRLHRVVREHQATPFERYQRTVATVYDEPPTEEALKYVSPEFLGQALVAVPREAALRWAPVFGDLLGRAAVAALARAQLPSAAMDVLAADSDTPWIRISAPKLNAERHSMFSQLSTWGGLRNGDFRSMFFDDEGVRTKQSEALDTALAEAHASGYWLYSSYIPGEAIGLLLEAMPSASSELDHLFSQAATQGKLSAIVSVIEAAVEWGVPAGSARALHWFDFLEAVDITVRHTDDATGLLRRHTALARAQPTPEAEMRWRRQIGAQENDLDLYRFINALAASNSDWLRAEAMRELSSGSPRGRALALVMASALDDDGAMLTEIQRQVCGERESWYDQLCKMSWQYVSRGRDQRHWLREALLPDDPVVRARGAFLFEFLSHPRGPQDLHHLLRSRGAEGVDVAKLRRLPPLHGRTRQLSEWGKHMSQRLLGSKRLEHACAPWLPPGVA